MSYISEYNTSDFADGESVRYVPGHAHGNIEHADCQNGIVSSKNDTNVFVRYFHRDVLQEIGQATNPKDLIKVKLKAE